MLQKTSLGNTLCNGMPNLVQNSSNFLKINFLCFYYFKLERIFNRQNLHCWADKKNLCEVISNEIYLERLTPSHDPQLCTTKIEVRWKFKACIISRGTQFEQSFQNCYKNTKKNNLIYLTFPYTYVTNFGKLLEFCTKCTVLKNINWRSF